MIENSNFKVKEIPDFHPIAQVYESDEWWREQKRRCIEGYWVGGKWMPPELYYYINFHNIIFESGIYRGIGLPWLRDIDWEKAFIYTEATGFSGFEKEEELSCHRFLVDDEKSDEDILRFCTPKDKNEPDPLFYNNFFKKDGQRKTYVSARDYLRKIHKENLGKPLYFNEAQHIIEMASRGYGKEVPDYQLVETINGQVRIDSLNIGDKILGRDGKETTVTAIYPQGIKDIYRITLADGREIECGLEHQWGLYLHNKTYKVVTTKDILERGLQINGKRARNYKWYLPAINPVEYKKKNLPIDPYILGCLIGDGTLTGGTPKIASDDEEILTYFRKNLTNFVLKKDTYTPNNYTISYVGKDKFNKKHPYGHNPLANKIRKLGLNTTCYTKFIPEIYKYGSIDQRLNMVQGLMDTDGSINTDGAIEFTNTSKELVEDLAYVLRSLGIRCQLGIDNRIGRKHILPQGTEHTTDRVVYRLFIRTDKNIFKLKRKATRLKRRKRTENIPIIKIEKTGKTSQRCITVDNDEHLFLLENFVPTHNSYNASALILHNFLFDGARDYDLYLKLRKEQKPLQTETVVGAIDAKYSNKLVSKVKTALERLPGSKVMAVDGNKILFPSPLTINYTGSFAVGREAISTISKSIVQHVTFADNPLAAAGGRPNKVFIDEVGFMNVIKQAWEGVENTQAAADFKRLTMYGLGTGGLTAGGAVTYLQDIFYNPEAYNCLSFKDIWENKGNIGYFVPGTQALNQFKEGPNLITNEAKALAFIEKGREKAKKSKDKVKIQGTIINKPIKPSEVFLRLEGTKFPTYELKKALADLESNSILLKASYKVDLLEVKKDIIELIPTNKPLITEFPLQRDADMDACIEIYEKPVHDVEGMVFEGRYIASTDPVDDDGNDDTTRSLQSTFILDTWTDRLVAEYTARTYLASEYYDNVRKLCLFYRAQNLYENNKKGLYGHFKNKHYLNLLAETPKILTDKNLVKTVGIGNKALGVNVTSPRVIQYGIDLILEWLEKPAYHNPEIKNMYTIRSRALLKELIAYDPEINADRVSALIALMIFRQEVNYKVEQTKNKRIKTTASSEFWGRSYKPFNKDKVYRNTNKYKKY